MLISGLVLHSSLETMPVYADKTNEHIVKDFKTKSLFDPQKWITANWTSQNSLTDRTFEIGSNFMERASFV